MHNDIKALCFDVFGTVVDWRSTVISEGEAINKAKGWTIDWAAFADAWRGMYQPSMQKVRNGEREWVVLDVLHRESLDVLLQDFAIDDLSESERDQLNRVWHRLNPWPDAVEGLQRLKTKFILATLSNGNVALLVNMAKHSNLPWDAVLGAEVARQYKKRPETYLITASMLGLDPGQCLMVAAHNDDLVVAGELGFRTAFVARPFEHGPNQNKDLVAENAYDLVANDFLDLADQLVC